MRLELQNLRRFKLSLKTIYLIATFSWEYLLKYPSIIQFNFVEIPRERIIEAFRGFDFFQLEFWFMIFKSSQDKLAINGLYYKI